MRGSTGRSPIKLGKLPIQPKKPGQNGLAWKGAVLPLWDKSPRRGVHQMCCGSGGRTL